MDTEAPTLPFRDTLFEAWGDFVPWSEYPQTNAWDFFGADGSGGYFSPSSTLYDRSDGRWLPHYETEFDLARSRGQSRRLASITSTYFAVMQALRFYVFGGEPTLTVSAAEGREPPLQLVDQIKAVCESVIADNELFGELGDEVHDRTREDGEALVSIHRNERRRGHIRLEMIEPDQLTQPANPSQLYDWLEAKFGICCSGPQSWAFGVHCPPRQQSHPFGYHVVYDGSGHDWDYIPVGRMLHLKRNTGRNAARGVSDYLPVLSDLQQEVKLARNMFQGAALQAAIAWIEQMPSGATQSQAQNLGNTDLSYQKPTNVGAGGGQRTQKATVYGPGSIVRPSAGREYKPGPMGSERNAGFGIAAQYAMRRIGIRWLMPEYMVSGDASNANYSNTITATSPFVRAREAEQRYFSRGEVRLLWKCVRFAFEMGLIPAAAGLPWELVESLVLIKVDMPAVANRDPLQLQQQLKGEVEMGVTSLQTAAAEMGRNLDEEIAAGAKPANADAAAHLGSDQSNPAIDPPADPTQAPVDPNAGEQVQDAALNGAQVQSLITIVQAVATGQMPLASGRATIQASFPLLSADQVDAIVAPLAAFDPKPAQPDAAAVQKIVNESLMQLAARTRQRVLWEGYP